MVPSVQHVVIVCANDHVMVMAYILDDFSGTQQANTDEQILLEIARTMKVHEYNGVNPFLPIKFWQRISSDSIPTNRKYRQAWSHDGTNFGHNLDKVKEILIEKVREKRNAMMNNLDVQIMKAIPKNDQVLIQKVEADKQVLRDIPQNLMSNWKDAQSVEELEKLADNAF